jgi:thiamine pyrophosphokinase
MEQKRIFIFANGLLHAEFLKDIIPSDMIIGVDKAAYWLIKKHVQVSIAIGDFDSVTEKELDIIKKNIPHIRSYPPQKDFTDLHLAFEYALEQNPKEIIMYGALGTRMDHSLASLFLLKKALMKKVPTKIIDTENELFLLESQCKIEKTRQYPYLSLLPFTDEIIVSIQGCAYDLIKRKIVQGESIGVSNEIKKSEAYIHVHQGIALVIRSRDT